LSQLTRWTEIQSRKAGGHNALSSAVAECSPARSAVGLPVYSFSGGGQECLQDLQTRPLLGHKGPLADARAARKCGGGGSTEGQLTFLSRSGVQHRTPAPQTHSQQLNGGVLHDCK
ncbi:hypothetical protein XENORESO_009915, partial [Xenotaenia resolanae]